MKRLAVLAPLLLASIVQAAPQRTPQPVPSGVVITPEAARGALFQPLNPDLKDLPDFNAGQASAVALSPDGKTLAILTSGFNRNFNAKADPVLSQSGEYLFLYDVTGPKPVKRQVLGLADSYIGLVWAPDGQSLYASGGVDDVVVEFKAGAEGFTRGRTLALGHSEAPGLYVTPHAAGLAISPNGQRLLVANYQNDSVSLIDLATGKVSAELDLRPGRLNPADRGKPGGTFPRTVAFVGDDRAVVGVERDRELVALDIGPASLKLAARRKVKGQPTALLANRTGSRLYAALDNTDRALVIDPRSLTILESIATAAPTGVLKAPKLLGGAGSNALALSPDGKTLLVSNGGENAVAVVKLSAIAQGLTPKAAPKDDDGDGDDDAPTAKAVDRSRVVGLIPTGWYPTGVAFNRAGDRIFAVNGKSPPGPNPGGCRNSLSLKKDLCRATNQYVWQLEKAGFLTLPAPSGAELARLTRQVADNNGFSRALSDKERQVSAFLRAHIKHVIFIVKENRTYDQVLGDLAKGDGDPKLTLFPEANTPNHHALARNFVTLDRFFDSGESSNTGWNWTVAGRTTDFTEREAPVNYAVRGLQYDQEGTNRNVNVGYATSAERQAAMPLSPADPDVLPGTADVAAPDAPGGVEGKGYIWDAALKAGLSVRNYGFYGDLIRYEDKAKDAKIPLERDPHKAGLTVFHATKASLMPVSDPYFRSFDQAFPDFWRFQEWKREFEGYVQKGELPNLTLLRLNHDHFGNFAEAIDGLGTPDRQIADNDYAIGLVAETLSKSPFAKDTLIFIVEDDAQDGPDHVDAHRSIALIAGPYVKQGALISQRYTTVNLLKTIETVLGLDPLGLTDAFAAPMTEVFDIKASGAWSFKARPSDLLRGTGIPLPAGDTACARKPSRSPQWWVAAMQGQDFSAEDHLDTARFNRVLWQGLKGDAPYPALRSGKDLRADPQARRATKVSDACR